MRFVYNPDDEDDAQQYAGYVFNLPANRATEFVDYVKDPDKRAELEAAGKRVSPFVDVTGEQIAAFVAAKLAPWGACLVSGPVVDGVAKNQEDEERVATAERRHLEGTRDWAMGILEEVGKARHKEPWKEHKHPDEGRAHAWLDAHKDQLTALGA